MVSRIKVFHLRQSTKIIGGAEVAMEIDAKLAIDRGCRLAAEM